MSTERMVKLNLIFFFSSTPQNKGRGRGSEGEDKTGEGW